MSKCLKIALCGFCFHRMDECVKACVLLQSGAFTQNIYLNWRRLNAVVTGKGLDYLTCKV